MNANSLSNHLVLGEQYVINRVKDTFDISIRGQWSIDRIFSFSVDLKSMIKRTGLNSWKMLVDISNWQFSYNESPVIGALLMKELIREGLAKTAYINREDWDAKQRQDRKTLVQPESHKYEYAFFQERASSLKWLVK